MPFQSSPNLSVGCSIYRRAIEVHQHCHRFQSSSNLFGWAQCGDDRQISRQVIVSILTQPRLGAARCNLVFSSSKVSILTQPIGWVQLQLSVPGSEPDAGFNPHPAYRLGASPHRWQNRWVVIFCFQSSPNLLVGCSFSCQCRDLNRTRVSILTKPLGRVHGYTGSSIAVAGFNPHPTDRLGAKGCGPLRVSILTQPIGWVQHICYYLITVLVSILAQSLGWVQRHTGGRL